MWILNPSAKPIYKGWDTLDKEPRLLNPVHECLVRSEIDSVIKNMEIMEHLHLSKIEIYKFIIAVCLFVSLYVWS